MAPASDDRDRRQILADKLQLLIERWEYQHGGELQYPVIASFVEDGGLALTRTRWHRIRTGSASSAWDPNLIRLIAEFFGVPASYLLEIDGQLPPKAAAEIQLILELQAAQIQSISARVVGEVSPSALQEITEILRRRNKG